MEKLVSIIIPVYNSESFIDRCIGSCLSQSHRNFEIICVNDGSTDRSADMLNRHALADPRVKVIHKPNGGVTSARMTGLAAASADWISFLDADDHLYSRAVEMFVKQQAETGADIVIGRSTSASGELGEKTSVVPFNSYSGIEYLRMLLCAKTSGNIWGMLIHKKIFAGVETPLSIKWAEDYATVIQLVGQSERISVLNFNLYCYVDNPESVTKMRNIDVLLTQFDALNCVKQFLVKSGLVNLFYKDMCCLELRWELSAFHLLLRKGYKKNNLRKLAWKYLVLDPALGFFCLKTTPGIKRVCLVISLISPVFAAWLLWHYGQFRMKMIRRG